MKRTVETLFCDLCGREFKLNAGSPIHLSESGGKNVFLCYRYSAGDVGYEYARLDLCDICHESLVDTLTSCFNRRRVMPDN